MICIHMAIILIFYDLFELVDYFKYKTVFNIIIRIQCSKKKVNLKYISWPRKYKCVLYPITKSFPDYQAKKSNNKNNQKQMLSGLYKNYGHFGRSLCLLKMKARLK